MWAGVIYTGTGVIDQINITVITEKFKIRQGNDK
jgi:hypothetical protein